MRSPAGILLSPAGLVPGRPRPSKPSTRRWAAASPVRVRRDRSSHDGDPREPARLSTLFASPGRPATRGDAPLPPRQRRGGAEWTMDSVRALGLGFNVLVPELRGHPPSTGARVTYGVRETERPAPPPRSRARRASASRPRASASTAARWAPFSRSSSPPHGLAGRALAPGAVRRPRRDGGPLPPLRHGSARAFSSTLPVRLLVRRIERTEGLDLSEATRSGGRAPRDVPDDVVHGETDALVPIRFSPRLYEALAGEKTFWRVPALRPLPPRGRAAGRGARRVRDGAGRSSSGSGWARRYSSGEGGPGGNTSVFPPFLADARPASPGETAKRSAGLAARTRPRTPRSRRKA